ncbi:hypothetical protein BGX24_010242 [Mortierella sp. AD032]|nr:hypothetical protein BGX24_010242 [Mortierella sp. AD032]
MLESCDGNCSTHWNLGFDHGLAALAGVKVNSGPASCMMPLPVTGRSEDKIVNEFLRLCNGRCCANAIYNTTIALSKRTEPPGVRTFVGLLSNWSSWVSCSMYDALEGKTDRDSLASAYTKIAAVINYASVKNPDSSGSILRLNVYAWQICDSRHPVIACSLLSDDPGLGPINTSATWHHVGILGLEPTKLVDHSMQGGELHGKHVSLIKRTWDMLTKDTTGLATEVLYYGHVWLLEQRAIFRVPTADEIAEVEDSLRIALLTVMMEIERADAVEAVWCCMIESWYASDIIWHSMISSTAYFSTRKVGSDRVDDKNVLQSWAEP